jgi:hypothetical protein
MSKSVDRLTKELSSMKDNHELKDIKFFLGDDRNIAQKELVDEAANGLSQIRFGNSEEVKCVDNKVNKLTVEQFI